MGREQTYAGGTIEPLLPEIRGLYRDQSSSACPSVVALKYFIGISSLPLPSKTVLVISIRQVPTFFKFASTLRKEGPTVRSQGNGRTCPLFQGFLAGLVVSFTFLCRTTFVCAEILMFQLAAHWIKK